MTPRFVQCSCYPILLGVGILVEEESDEVHRYGEDDGGVAFCGDAAEGLEVAELGGRVMEGASPASPQSSP